MRGSVSMLREFKLMLGYSKRLALYQLATTALCFMVVPLVFLIAKETMGNILVIFTVIMLIYLCFLDFLHANRVGDKERSNSRVYKANYLKGFIIGLMGQLPMWIITIILVLNKDALFKPFSEGFQNVLGNMFTLQYTAVLGLMDYSMLSYFISIGIVPLICGVGYLIGMSGFSFEEKFGSINKR